MEGVGELFGQSVDDVLRRPRPALIPLAADLFALTLAAVLFTVATGAAAIAPFSRRLGDLAFTVPSALPTVGDVTGAPGGLELVGARGILAAAAFLLVTLPILAYLEGGFLSILRRAYLPTDDEERAATAPTLGEALDEGGRQHFVALLTLRLLGAVFLTSAIILPSHVPVLRNYAFAILAFNFLLLYAPFIVVLDGVNAWQAIRGSVTAVSDHLATSLVTLLFLILTTGGVSSVLAPLVHLSPAMGIVAGAFVYAPVGTALSLFVLRVYASFSRRDAMPLNAPARAESKLPTEGA